MQMNARDVSGKWGIFSQSSERRSVAIRLAMVVVMLCNAPMVTATTLSSLYLKASKNKTTAYFKLSNLPNYRSFILHAPLRVVVDFQNTITTNKILQKNFSNQTIKGVRIGHSSPKTTRVVFDLKRDSLIKVFWTKALKNNNGVLQVDILSKTSPINIVKKQPTQHKLVQHQHRLIQSRIVKNIPNYLYKPSRDVALAVDTAPAVNNAHAVNNAKKRASVVSGAEHSWTVAGGIGYTWYQAGYSDHSLPPTVSQNKIGDGKTAFGRFAIGRDLFTVYPIRIGVELGIQSGNIERLDTHQDTLDLLGGVPIQANIKPMIDLLFTGTTEPFESIPAYGVLKLGIAYRRMQINDRITVNDLSQGNFEIQCGLGKKISDRLNLALLYQGVLSGNTKFTVNAEDATGHITNIPKQNGLLLNLTYKFGDNRF